MGAVRLVLLRPRNADNLGAIARAMKNFGLSDWVVVTPNPKLLEAPGLHRLAVHAGELLEQVRVVDTLAEAVADCSWVVGTTGRRIPGRTRLWPSELSQAVSGREGTVALVFGDERSGLDNEDLSACDALSQIPASEAQPSLNLAQAVVIYAYALSQRPQPPSNGPRLATAAERQFLSETLARVLHAAGVLRRPDACEVGELTRVFAREALTHQESGRWAAALKGLEKALATR